MKILLTFVGTNDAGRLIGYNHGAILTALTNEKFDEVVLLWNEAKINNKFKYSDVVLNLKREIKKQKLAKKVFDYELYLKDVTDHNEIYEHLKDFTITLEKTEKIEFTAAISSGTPAMQVCWILLAESGDFSIEFPLRLIKVIDPKFGKSKNVNVKLNTSLPRIIGLQNEIDDIKNDLIPQAVMNIKHGTLKIGHLLIPLAPIEFCYYRYFTVKKLNKEKPQKFSGYNVSLNFVRSIYDYHAESYPDLDANRLDMENMIKKDFELPIATFRGNISKINKKLAKTLRNESIYNVFRIANEGIRGAKFYGLVAPVDKLRIS